MLSQYRAIAQISARMLEAARSGDWESLAAEEQLCREHVDVLRACGEQVLSAPEREEKREILLRLLADDAAIRELTEPWMRRLQGLIDSAGNERRLDASYGQRP